LEIVLDKRIVLSPSFDPIPVIEIGRITSGVPNTKGTAYVIVDAHPDAPNRLCSTCTLNPDDMVSVEAKKLGSVVSSLAEEGDAIIKALEEVFSRASG
jgi:hypothetical protein